MSIHDRTRQPAGTPTGGQFAQEARPAGGVILSDPVRAPSPPLISEQEVRDHVMGQASQAGWVLAGEQIARLQADGHVRASQAIVLTDAHMTILGEDVVAPTVDHVEDTLTQWMRADDRPHGTDGRLDTARLGRACDEAGIPGDVVGYLQAVEDRENVPTQFLSNLTGSELADLHEQFVGPAGERIAAEVDDPDSQMWCEAANR